MPLRYKHILERILPFLNLQDLFYLLMVCVNIRDIVGQSDIWKSYIKKSILAISELIHVEKLFQTLSELEPCQGYVHLRPYYGKFYYLYVLQVWRKRTNLVKVSYLNPATPNSKLSKMVCLAQILGSVYINSKNVKRFSNTLPSKLWRPEYKKILENVFIIINYPDVSADDKNIIITPPNKFNARGYTRPSWYADFYATFTKRAGVCDEVKVSFRDKQYILSGDEEYDNVILEIANRLNTTPELLRDVITYARCYSSSELDYSYNFLLPDN